MKQKGRSTPLYHQGKRDRKKLEKRRLKVAKLFEKGEINKSEIGRRYGVSPEAVRKWYEIWKKKGIDGLKSKGNPGPDPRLTEAKKDKVQQALLKGPQALGYTTNIWTLKRISQVIEKVAKVKFHPGYVWYILKAMNWSCQKPKVQSSKRDEKLIANWKRTTWPVIKKKGKN
ncbi:MAG: transposase [Candidatus Nealsonbacteria bacterium CG_4_10_14_0_2_um_filter_37_10]|uniref:Transposase n=3 Tax=Candidatus Nealsoniibacteriota TaxID=1817911 RepID=A0A2M7UZB2_9BACT|nr:MAG: transposase [Candidatus Nealsonbacteria bacterium CG10_big_fil_rev_8_21_14_0_10_37_25]PIZ89317.1 MAG: transposase [Candidatus Nealsonbacteria bacterium CG_4_10_14_0_2_um_filter_37_10]PJA83968.1 MAG: transposase [Candidatus Nealsonbacteria bacterium CG_4_9_14_3_um_filter_37_13]